MNDLTKNFEKYKEQFVKDLQGLLQIPSVLKNFDKDRAHPFGDDIHKALNYMLDLGERDGFKVRNIDNYAGEIEIGQGEEILGILGHLDVVPAGDNWKFGPWSGTVDDGKIYGRGALDDKGPTVAAYYALRLLKDAGVKFNKRVRLILGTDEESGMRGVEHYLSKEKMPDIGFAPDASFPLIYGEKGIMTAVIKGHCDKQGVHNFLFGERSNVVPDKATAVVEKRLEAPFREFLKKNNYKGDVNSVDDELVELFVYGKNAHAMEPDAGLNAGFILLTFLNENTENKLAEFARKYLTFDSRLKKLDLNYKNDEMGELTCNVGIGEYRDEIFTLTLNFRYPIHTNIEQMTEVFSNKAGKYGFTYDIVSNSKPHYVDPESKLVKTLHEAYIKYTGDDKSPIITIGGGTYARKLKNAVAFGPEMPHKEALVHQPNEYAPLEDLYTSTLIYAEAIYNLTR